MLDLDKNGDRTIDRMEWTTWNSKLMGAGTLTFADTLRLVFQEYDTDGSGTITRAELQSLFLDLLQKSADTVGTYRFEGRAGGGAELVMCRIEPNLGA